MHKQFLLLIICLIAYGTFLNTVDFFMYTIIADDFYAHHKSFKINRKHNYLSAINRIFSWMCHKSFKCSRCLHKKEDTMEMNTDHQGPKKSLKVHTVFCQNNASKFVYIFSYLFTFSAVCLLFWQLILHKNPCFFMTFLPQSFL